MWKILMIWIWFGMMGFVQEVGSTDFSLGEPFRKPVMVVTHEEIVASGARTLADLLERLPGVSITMGRHTSQPSAGSLISADSPTQLSANPFSRVLILFNGHSQNKLWHGGARQEWSTGFLESLREIRVYTGPSALLWPGRSGAMEMVIDLIPFAGHDQKGAVDFSLSQSLNARRLDRTKAHLRTGNLWGKNGEYSLFMDLSKSEGVEPRIWMGRSDWPLALERGDLSYQLGGQVRKGQTEFQSRFSDHGSIDVYGLGRKWTQLFAELKQTAKLGARLELKALASVDSILSRWGETDGVSGDEVDEWDRVSETRLNLSLDLVYRIERTALFLGIEGWNGWVKGGPDREGGRGSVMDFSNEERSLGLSLGFVQRLGQLFSLNVIMRLEKRLGFEQWSFLPDLSLNYRSKRFDAGLSFALGEHYIDSWYRVGSNYYDPDLPVLNVPYLVGRALTPERNMQGRLWFSNHFSGSWQLYTALYLGRYQHLMAFDWDYAIASRFLQKRARELGGYGYWGGVVETVCQLDRLRIVANLSLQGILSNALEDDRQLYLAQGGGKALFLPTLKGNLIVNWGLLKRLDLSGRLFFSGAATNGGVDLLAAQYPVVYNQGDFTDTPATARIDLSLNLKELWSHFSLLLSLHNVLNSQSLQPIVDGGVYAQRGREIALTLRGRF